MCVEKGVFEMTPQDSKEILSGVKPMLLQMEQKYKLIGQGAMSRDDDATGLGNSLILFATAMMIGIGFFQIKIRHS